MPPYISKYFYLFVLCFPTTLLNAQYLEQYEQADEISTGDTYGTLDWSINSEDEYIYTAGKTTFRGFKDTYVIRKLDTLGNICWSSAERGYFIPTSNFLRDFNLFDDNYLYLVTSETTNSGPKYLWKIDALDGSLAYKQVLPAQLDPSANRKVIPFNADTLLFSFRPASSPSTGSKGIAWIDRTTGVTLSIQDILAPQIESDVPIVVIDNDRHLIFSSADTLYKMNPFISDSIIWKTPLLSPYSNSTVSPQSLHYADGENALYVAGIIDNYSEGFASRLNTLTGEIEWMTFIESNDDIDFSNYLFDQAHYYVNWRPSTTGNSKVLVNKFDRITGEIVWESASNYEVGNNREQAGLEMIQDDNALYLTGYFTTSQGYTNWGMLKLQKSDGGLVYSTLITNIQQSIGSLGIGLKVLNDRVACLGTKRLEQNLGLATEQWVEIDNENGDILLEKIIPDTIPFPSAIVNIEQAGPGILAILQQHGTKAKLSLKTTNGETQWDTVFTSPNYANFQPQYLETINDSILFIGGIGSNDIELLFAPDPYDTYEQEMRFYIFNTNQRTFINYGQNLLGNSIRPLKIVDILCDPGTNNLFICGAQSDNLNLYRFDYGINVPAMLLADRTADNGTETSEWMTHAQLMVDVSPDHFLFISKNKWYRVPKTNLSLLTSYPGTGAARLHHIDTFPDGRFFVNGRIGYSPISYIIDPLDWEEIQYVQICQGSYAAKKWVQGESDNYIYSLCAGENSMAVAKYDITANSIVWQQEVSSSDPLYTLATVTDITFNTAGQYIAITGHRRSTTGGKEQLYFATLNTDGNITSAISHEAVGILQNARGLVLHSDASSTATVMGGTLKRAPGPSEAALFYINELSLENRIIAKVFLDYNQDGLQQTDEPTIPVGDFLIDNQQQLFPNQLGYIHHLTIPGLHEVSYQLPDQWQLTSEFLTYEVDPYDITQETDTLCFGISPTEDNANIRPFLNAEQFICNEENQVHLQFKNIGTTATDVQISLTYIGEFINADTPPENQQADTLFWLYSDILPGTTQTNTITLLSPTAQQLGELLTLELTATWYDTDGVTLIDTTFRYQDILLCSYDPNDKQVSPKGEGPASEILKNEALFYTIRFQNTGNFPAQDIEIIDDLHEGFDLPTFEFINASHPITEIKRVDSRLFFVFEDIWLPDSVNNEPESHGFVSFKISPQPNLPDNYVINNTASIYFDQNPAIVTNTVTNTLVNIISSNEEIPPPTKSNFLVAPNPVTNAFFIRKLADDGISYPLVLHDARGRVVQRCTLVDNEKEITTSTLAAGLYLLRIGHLEVIKIIIK
ncbi:MAG: T9SS type A sorting domain-containing protein [Lewinella sp.]|uniref:T9SS type A sorting domain-containing protein n=1 Tax=Lewinella sp. TaxID=2004506 RepID=UPI003D6C5854